MSDTQECPPAPKLEPINRDNSRPVDPETLRIVDKIVSFSPREERTRNTICFEKNVKENVARLPDYILRIFSKNFYGYKGVDRVVDTYPPEKRSERISGGSYNGEATRENLAAEY